MDLKSINIGNERIGMDAKKELREALQLLHEHAMLYLPRYEEHQNVFDTVTAALRTHENCRQESESEVAFRHKDSHEIRYVLSIPPDDESEWEDVYISTIPPSAIEAAAIMRAEEVAKKYHAGGIGSEFDAGMAHAASSIEDELRRMAEGEK